MKGLVRHNGGWRSWRNAAVACLSAAFLLFSNSVFAASLETIDVVSALGEPLYAEVPLLLDGNELVSKVFIEIASAADYKIFEVYRDPILNSIRAYVASDERGARVQLTSRSGIKTPFFNLVLKVRYGRVSHFKKYSVFLDSAKGIERIVAKEPLPHVDVAKVAALAPANKVVAKLEEANAKRSVGWARTERYGPIVRGDSLSIVAGRLRLDKRYSGNQVMVALFEKNRGSFDKENMNLIKAGSYLRSPSGEEVEKLGRSEAFRVVAHHEARWKKQARYPIQLAVQRSRYSNRVRFGDQADAQPSTSAVKLVEATQDLLVAEKRGAAAPLIETPAVLKAAALASSEDVTRPQVQQFMHVQSETNQLLLALQEKNEELQQQLMSNKESVDGLRSKMGEGSVAASNARVAKLEILLTRLQAQLDRQAKQPIANIQTTSAFDLVTWILLSLVIVMLGVIAMRMRKEPVHPASGQLLSENNVEFVTDRELNVDSLEKVIEEGAGSFETDATTGSVAHAGTLDGLPSFSDELSDTDAAELEVFDADVKKEADPNVDYVSESDVYIRYGMNDEALQQLDLALRVNPVNTDAHVKKAELLYDKQDKAGFAAAVNAATVALAAAELEQYQSVIESFGGVDEIKNDALPSMNAEKTGDLASSFEAGASQELGSLFSEDGIEEMKEITEPFEPGGTQRLDALLGEFSDDEDDSLNFSSVDDDFVVTIIDDVRTDALSNVESLGANLDHGSTQKLDNLLAEFAGEGGDSNEQPSADLPDLPSNSSDHGDTQVLGNLLDEFKLDDDETDRKR